MLKDLARRLGAGLVAAVMMAVAAGVVLVAAAFAVYAGMERLVSPAAAAAVTALVFAAVAALIAFFAPRLIKGGPARAQPAHKPPVDPATIRTVSEIGMAVLGVLGDVALSRRRRRRAQARKHGQKRR